jgi:hypothetical protein
MIKTTGRIRQRRALQIVLFKFKGKALPFAHIPTSRLSHPIRIPSSLLCGVQHKSHSRFSPSGLCDSSNLWPAIPIAILLPGPVFSVILFLSCTNKALLFSYISMIRHLFNDFVFYPNILYRFLRLRLLFSALLIPLWPIFSYVASDIFSQVRPAVSGN